MCEELYVVKMELGFGEVFVDIDSNMYLKEGRWYDVDTDEYARDFEVIDQQYLDECLRCRG